jgi:hypothetical protein
VEPHSLAEEGEMSCPLHNDITAGRPENPERWAPPTPIIGASFQLHDFTLLLYRVAHARNDATRKQGLESAIQAIESTLAFIKAEVGKL